MLTADECCLTHLMLPNEINKQTHLLARVENIAHPVLAPFIHLLDRYFLGDVIDFNTLALAPVGTPFQTAVWQALREIPYGEHCCYADIALKIGKPKAVRAVGGAIGANPIAIFIPCHRVLGKNGTLTGYSGGLTIKKALLERENISYKTK